MFEKYRFLFNFVTTTGVLGAFAALVFNIASDSPDEELLTNDSKNTYKISPIPVTYITNQDIKTEKMLAKTTDFNTMKNIYKSKKVSAKTNDGVDIFLTTDNNHKPCYISKNDLISHTGKKIPFNFVPPGMRCDNIGIVESNNNAAVVINSLNWFLDEKASYPIGYAFKIDGEGLGGTVYNCGTYWSDNCNIPTQSKIIITNKTPLDVPTPRSIDSVVLTSKLPSGFLNGSKSNWKYNQKFYTWKRVPFASKFAVNGLSDGKYVETTEEAYNKGYDVAIVLKTGEILLKSTQGGENFCYVNDEGFTVNENGMKLPSVKIPTSLNCRTAETLDEKLLITRISDIVDWKDAPKGYQIITNAIFDNKVNILENCGTYWSDTCKNPQNERVVVAKERKNVVANRSKDRIVFTTHIDGKTNIAGGVKNSKGLYVWEDVNVPTSVNGLADIMPCGYTSNCYLDKMIKASGFAKAPNKSYIKYKENINGVGLWFSMDEQYILSPISNMKWSTVKNQNNISGISKDGKFFYKGRDKKSFIDAEKECYSLGMNIPEPEDTDITSKNGITSNDWAWVRSKESSIEYAIWKKGTLSRDLSTNKNNVICVSTDL